MSCRYWLHVLLVACEFASLQLMGFLYYSAAAAAGIVVLLVCIDRFKKKYATTHPALVRPGSSGGVV